MSNLNCLKEIESPYVFQSQLTSSQASTRYCVLAENNFIIFGKSSDCISLFRIPLNKKTQLLFMEKKFTITYNNFSLSFSHKDQSVIQSWSNFLNIAINMDIPIILSDFNAEVVKIDKIKSDCPIVIGKNDYRLYIYETYDLQRNDVCRYVINLKFYPSTLISLYQDRLNLPSKIVTLKGSYGELKLTFTEHMIAVKWVDILRNAVSNYLNSLTDGVVLNSIYKNQSNRYCADCGAFDPKWVSINICITLCDDCVVFHRKFGVKISVTKSATIDEKCWKDSLLINLLNEIGNAIANKFWFKNPPSGEVLSASDKAERKYKRKDFIDGLYSSLSEEEIVTKLLISVRTTNVNETMCLWFSNKTDFHEEIVDSLLKAARESQQILQDKFITLQQNIIRKEVTNEEVIKPKYSGLFYLSLNNKKKMNTLYNVCVYNDRLVIKIENLKKLSKEKIDLCVIYFKLINIVRLSCSNDFLQISLNSYCKFSNVSDSRIDNINSIDVNTLFINSTSNSLNNFKKMLFNELLPNHFEPPNGETSLFLSTQIRMNKKELINCKCHLTINNFIIWNPFIKYDLTKALELKITEDKKGVFINISNDQIYIESIDNCDLIFNCLKEASEIQILTLKNDYISLKFNKMIEFIRFFGISCEKIFQICGDREKVESLFLKIIENSNELSINRSDYSAHDVVTCLKKCFLHLEEPLIPSGFFAKFNQAAQSEIGDHMLFSFKKAIKLLPVGSFKILQHIIEVLFIITKISNCEQLSREFLAEVVAPWLLSPEEKNKQFNNGILKFLIKYFVLIFNYSEEDQISVLSFIDQRKNETSRFTRRTFCLNSDLINDLTVNYRNISEPIKLTFLDDVKSFVSVSFAVHNFTLVSDLSKHLFNCLGSERINLWHFVDVKGKIFKRLLYFNDNANNVIIQSFKFPNNCSTGQLIDHFIFLEKNLDKMKKDEPFCNYNVKINKEINKMVISLSNSLKIFKKNSENPENPEYDLKLSDIFLYRPKISTAMKIYILYEDKNVIGCEFIDCADFKDFLLYFDSFRSRGS